MVDLKGIEPLLCGWWKPVCFMTSTNFSSATELQALNELLAHLTRRAGTLPWGETRPAGDSGSFVPVIYSRVTSATTTRIQP